MIDILQHENDDCDDCNEKYTAGQEASNVSTVRDSGLRTSIVWLFVGGVGGYSSGVYVNGDVGGLCR